MATYGPTLRRGAPRTPGGQPWPQVGDAAVSETAQTPTAELVAPDAATTAGSLPVRRGLPRVSGGQPWPSAAEIVPAAPAHLSASQLPTPAIPVALLAGHDAAPATSAATVGSVTNEDAAALRRGLPRTPGGDGWPPAGSVARVGATEVTAPGAPQMTPPTRASEVGASTISEAATVPDPFAVVVTSAAIDPPPLAPTVTPDPSPKQARTQSPTRTQWVKAGILGGLGLLVTAALAVVAVRWLLSTEPMQDFLADFPGEYHLPAGAPVGFPGWLGWQHFFNVFLMVLIIRSGLRVRTEKRPTAFWTPRRDQSGKVSLMAWFHQSLDVLWLVNGVVFVILLFVTGQWMRVVPTSWEVFPNALSAALQYVSLDWPTDNGWVNYNSLQQLAYFATIFVAAPLAAITGYRMSGMWPKSAKALNRVYPIEWARSVHFPVMLYFVAFIFIHIALVLSTGALRNLNHMYAAQGSAVAAGYADNWTGFWMFVASLVVIAAAWIAARPMVLAPIARLFGTVSRR